MNRLSTQNRTTSYLRHSTPIVSILSGKGGVGKTVLSFNLSERFAAMGRRVLLIDADVSSGNVHILANVGSKRGLAHVLAGTYSLKEAVVSAGKGLTLLASPQSRAALTVEDSASLLQTLSVHSSDYDLILIDHSSGIHDSVTPLVAASAVNIVVVVPELTSISDSYGMFKQLIPDTSRTQCCLLINRVKDKGEAEHVRNKFCALSEQFLGRVPDCIGHVRNDDQVRISVARQRPVAALSPESGAAEDMSDIARKLLSGLKIGRHSSAQTIDTTINIGTQLADIRE